MFILPLLWYWDVISVFSKGDFQIIEELFVLISVGDSSKNDGRYAKLGGDHVFPTHAMVPNFFK
jgi:hypothetical protein